MGTVLAHNFFRAQAVVCTPLMAAAVDMLFSILLDGVENQVYEVEAQPQRAMQGPFTSPGTRVSGGFLGKGMSPFTFSSVHPGPMRGHLQSHLSDGKVKAQRG